MKNLLFVFFACLSITIQAQTGHVLQGAGASNFSMGGAGTALPIDILGSLQWNPASITAFEHTEIGLSAAYFTAAPEVYSKVQQPDGQGGFITIEGTTEDEMGASILPTLGAVIKLPDSKLTFGLSAFGISGFGVDYPETTNLPLPDNANFDPTNSNPLLYPQSMMGFGHLNSEYQLMQVGLTGAYEVAKGLSLGVGPTFNYSSLLIQPVPIGAPSAKGYSVGEKDSALGIGFQAGLFYKTTMGLNFGLTYKSTQWFKDLEIDGKYVDGSEAETIVFNLDYPSIISAGVGYSHKLFDLAVDYRFINYENTDGFEQSGWVIAENGFPTGAVAGFGWKNVNVVAAGVQLKLIQKVPIRLGYTFSSSPIDEDNVFFSAPAPAVIAHAIQFGFAYKISDNFDISLAYHHGMTAEVSGQMLSPSLITASDPLGKVPGSEITSKMHTDVGLLGIAYRFGK